jgi:hypothetical protein
VTAIRNCDTPTSPISLNGTQTTLWQGHQNGSGYLVIESPISLPNFELHFWYTDGTYKDIYIERSPQAINRSTFPVMLPENSESIQRIDMVLTDTLNMQLSVRLCSLP